MDKAWYVDYATNDWAHCYLVIHCATRDGVKPILKKHLGGAPFKINRITEWSVSDERKEN